MHQGCNLELFEGGERLFLTTEERHRFKEAIGSLDTLQRIYCRLLYYTGCKVSEANKIYPDQVYANNKSIRLGLAAGNLLERSIPVPYALQLEFSIYFPWQKVAIDQPLWSISRPTGWRIVNNAMKNAGISGKQATPTGLRHSFAISCLEVWPRIPLSQIQKWLGHRNVDLTMSYFKAFMQTEDAASMEDLWNHF